LRKYFCYELIVRGSFC